MKWNIILFGILGAILPDILRIVKDRYSSNLPVYLKSANFWLGTFFLLILGGLAAWLLNAKSVVEALSYGFGAPELISKLLATKPSAGKDRGHRSNKSLSIRAIREWWAI